MHVSTRRTAADLGPLAPPNFSINNGIGLAICSVRYPTVDQGVTLILELQPGALLVKVGVAHAFQNILAHLDNCHLLGMRWDNSIFLDLILPFGLRSFAKIFVFVADALEWVLICKGMSWCTHYIDDFLVMNQPNTLECETREI